MTRKELIKHCRYYKGEKACPFDEETQEYPYLFWHTEQQVLDGFLNTEKEQEGWIRTAEYQSISSSSTPPEYSKLPPIERAIYYLVDGLLGKWCPYTYHEDLPHYLTDSE